MKPSVKYALFIAVALGALAAGVWFGEGRYAFVKPNASERYAATQLVELTLNDLDGRSQPLSQWRGKKWVVNLWATWCAPCREEMPMLAELSREYGGEVQFIGIGIDSAEAMRKFTQETPVPYPLLVGGREVIELTSLLGNDAMALPFTLVLDASGTVREHHTGMLTKKQLVSLIGSNPSR